jgi:transposase
MKKPLAVRENIIVAYLNNEIDKKKAAEILRCTSRTIEIYCLKYIKFGVNGLIDHRHSNNFKLTQAQKDKIVVLKDSDRWRSARNIRDDLNLKIHPVTVWRIICKAGLNRENIKRVKPITRFQAEYPNQMWQTDIMGRIDFPKAGTGYLIATLDDYSRFVPAARWFKIQGKMNVFAIWYESLSKCGIPEKMLQDEGSQYKARVRFGNADYEWYAKQLGIELIWAKKAETKGKIERFWKFVQSDFVRSVWEARTIDEINGKFRLWLAAYNYKFKSSYFDGKTRADRYSRSEKKIKRVELETLLLVEERRKVTRESTISLYGKHYFVPPGYIGCRIWAKIVGNKVLFEAGGKVFHKTRLRLT